MPEELETPTEGNVEYPTKTNRERECPWLEDGGEYADDFDQMPDNS